MSYRLDLDRRPATTTRRTLVAQLEQAVGRLQGETGEDRAAVLHDVRTDLKKSRTLLRLMRPALPADLYRSEMATLRDSARTISAARDADALPVALTQLYERYVGRLPESTYVALEARLVERAHTSDAQAPLVDEAATLGAARDRVKGWPLQELRWVDVVDELQHTYRRGRLAFGHARRQPSDENLHEWRKRLKDLLYQLRLLQAAWPTVLGAYVQEAHRLADLLGDDHDLTVLIAVLRDSAGPATLLPTSADPLIELAAQRRAKLQAEAWALGERLYGESPKAFRRRIMGLVQAARSRAKRPHAVLERVA